MEVQDSILERVIETVLNHPWRTRTSDGRAGGLIDMPGDAVPIIVGDLHSNLPYLKLIIEHRDNLRDIEAGKKVLVFIGDTVHNDQTGHMKEMETSVEILEFIIDLMSRNPRSVIYLKGNHDTFDERLVKSGIFQGKELKAALLHHKGPEYLALMVKFFDSLPHCILGPQYVLVHAGPPRGGITREELIEIDKYPEKKHQLIWNRIHEFRGNPNGKEYGHQDVESMLTALGLAPDSLFIVGHNPLWGTGEKTGVWMDVLGIKNHHIIYSGWGTKAPYFEIRAGELSLHFPEIPVIKENPYA